VLVIFRLGRAEPRRTLHLQNLEPDAYYRLTAADGDGLWCRRGKDLMQHGFCVDYLGEEDSTIIVLTEERSGI
jgi:hypothetical protein